MTALSGGVPPALREEEVQEPPDGGAPSARLSNDAVEWLIHGEQGASSRYIFDWLLLGEERSVFEEHPWDAHDFRRCLDLLAAVPELRPLLPRMADRGPVWAVLIERWDELTALYAEEAVGGAYARRASDLIHEIVMSSRPMSVSSAWLREWRLDHPLASPKATPTVGRSPRRRPMTTPPAGPQEATEPKVVTANPEFGWFAIDGTIWLAWQGEPGQSNLYEVHCPVGEPTRKHAIGWIDLTSGTKHQLVSLDPLHIEASIACHSCSFHGFIRGGRWVPA